MVSRFVILTHHTIEKSEALRSRFDEDQIAKIARMVVSFEGMKGAESEKEREWATEFLEVDQDNDNHNHPECY